MRLCACPSVQAGLCAPAPQKQSGLRGTFLKNVTMILYNIRVAFRRLSRQKIHTSLHVLGLTLGITVCLLIGLFIRHELSFDSYHDNTDRTYRINTIWTDAGIKQKHYSTPFPLAQTLRKEISGLKYVTHVHHLVAIIARTPAINTNKPASPRNCRIS